MICDDCGNPLCKADIIVGAETCSDCDRRKITAAVARAQAARDAGVARAERSATDADRDRIDAAIASVAKRGGEFSANDVRPLVPNVPGPLMGARFLAASRAGRIVKVGYVTSTDPGTHAHPVALWRAA